MHTRATVGAAFLVVMLAACGGSSATQAPGGANNGGNAGGTPTQAPAATEDNGDGGNGDGGNGDGGNGDGGNGAPDTTFGSGHVDIGGVASASVDLGFSPILSHFGGTDSTILYLLPADSEGALALTWSSGEFIAVFTSTQVTVSGIECSTSNLQIGSTSAKGSFECSKNYVVLSSGASAADASFKGTFDVHG